MTQNRVKQTELPFNQNPSLEEMGQILQGRKVLLHQSFLSDRLSAGAVDTERVGEVEDIKCPLCHKGHLKLTKVSPKFQESRSALKSYHTGNDYKYCCTNPNCSAVFVGSYTWQFID